MKTWHDKYHIYFVDYGNEDKAVPSNFVKKIPSHLLEVQGSTVDSRFTEYWLSTDM